MALVPSKPMAGTLALACYRSVWGSSCRIGCGGLRMESGTWGRLALRRFGPLGKQVVGSSFVVVACCSLAGSSAGSLVGSLAGSLAAVGCRTVVGTGFAPRPPCRLDRKS